LKQIFEWSYQNKLSYPEQPKQVNMALKRSHSKNRGRDFTFVKQVVISW